MPADASHATIDAPLVNAAIPATPSETPHPVRLILDLGNVDDATLKTALVTVVGSSIRPVIRHVERTYWDTPDFELGRAGFAVGLRRSGARHWQRILAIGARRQGGGAVLDVETITTGGRPDLVRLALQPGADARRIGALDAEALVPVFAIDAKRTAWRIGDWRGTGLVLTMETGTIRSPAGEQPICQLILDTETGPASGAYEFARLLWQTLPLELAEFDSAQAGYRLVAKADWWPDATKAKLTPEMSTRDGILAIGRAALASMRLEMAPLADSATPERVHQARVSIRRLRSVLSVYQPVLPAEPRRRFSRSLGMLANVLGETREWDVFLAETLAPIAQAMPDESGITSLRLSTAVLREQATASLLEQAVISAFPILSLMLGAWFDAGIWPAAEAGEAAEQQFLLDQPLGQFARDILRKRHRRVMNTAAAFDDPRPAELHELRLHAKKLRYTAEFFAALYPPKAAKPYIVALRQVQEVLGQINDASVTPALLERLRAARHDTSYTTGLVMGWTAARAELARKHFADAWKELEKAKRFWKAE
jgi:CHAD domain-containing protein